MNEQKMDFYFVHDTIHNRDIYSSVLEYFPIKTNISLLKLSFCGLLRKSTSYTVTSEISLLVELARKRFLLKTSIKTRKHDLKKLN